MAKNTFNLRRGRWCKFPLQIGLFKELFKVNLRVRIFQLNDGFGVDAVIDAVF